MKRFLCRAMVPGLIIVVGQWVVQARAAAPRPFNLEEMVVMADRIFIGIAVDHRTGWDQRGLPATFTTFTISRALKGSPGDRIRVKQIQPPRIGSNGSTEWVPGIPQYQLEGEYLVFLMPDNALGFTSPVGALQGAFEVRSADGGVKSVVNGVDNTNLLIGLAEGDLTRLGLRSAKKSFLSRGRGLLRLNVMVSAIERARNDREGISLQDAVTDPPVAEPPDNTVSGEGSSPAG